MKVNDINPYLRYIQKSNFHPINDFVCAFDYHFYYIVSGNGELIIMENTYQIHAGMIIIIKPGEKYHFKDCRDLDIIDFNFDYTQTHTDIIHGIMPVKLHDFNANGITETVCFDDEKMLNDNIVLENVHFLHEDLNAILKEYQYQKLYYQNVISSMFKGIIFKLIRFMNSDSKSINEIDVILEYIHQHFSKNIDNRLLAGIVGYHPYYINSIVKKHTGITLRQYIINYRIERAKDMLCSTDMTISEISEKCGYLSVSYFSTAFKDRTGESAGQYRKNAKNYL